MNKFITIFIGSSGSSWLMDSLGRLDGVCIPAFEPIDEPNIAEEPQRVSWINTCFDTPSNDDEFRRWYTKLDSISPLYKQFTDECVYNANLIDFKTRAYNLSFGKLQEIVNNNNVSVIFLHRENILKQVVSLHRRNVEKKSQFHENTGHIPSTIEPDILQQRFENISADLDKFWM